MKSEDDKTHSNSQWGVNDKSRLYNALITLQGKRNFFRILLIMKTSKQKKSFQIKTVLYKR